MFIGIKCITDHEEFQPVVLHKGTLWTAHVALHDRESHLSKQRNDLPNRYPINSLLPTVPSPIVHFYGLLTLYLMKISFLVGVENNNDFDSTDDKMEERGDHDDSPCIKISFLCRSLRYAAYGQFCWWIHARLGKGVRRIIPVCVVKKIRGEYQVQIVVIQGFKRILKSRKQNVHGSLKSSRQIFTFFWSVLCSICFTSHCNNTNYRRATSGEGLSCSFLK